MCIVVWMLVVVLVLVLTSRDVRVEFTGLAGRCAVSHVHTYSIVPAHPSLPLKLHDDILIAAAFSKAANLLPNFSYGTSNHAWRITHE